MPVEYPLVKAIKRNRRKIKHRFHVPASAVTGYNFELTELPGLDVLSCPGEAIKEAQQYAAGYFGSCEAYFLVNGSTAGITAAILSVCARGEKVLLPRNIHGSVVAGLIFSGAEPVFVPVKNSNHAGIPLNVSPGELESILKKEECRMVLVTNPSYLGISGDLTALSSIVVGRETVLMVDEAHGGHFCLSPVFPRGASEEGADLWVNSAHKTLGALTPGALLHVNSSKINSNRLQFYLGLLQTSSPSYPVMASLDLVRKKWNNEWERVRELAERARERINRETGFSCLKEEDLGKGFQMDPLRLTIITSKVTLDGYQVAHKLREEMGIEVELAGLNYILVIFQPGLKKRAVEALLKALRLISRRYHTGKEALVPEESPPVPSLGMLPSDAVKVPWEEAELKKAAGKIAANVVSVFPPGIPDLIPGEVISPGIIDRLIENISRGASCTGIKEGSMVNVVKS